MSLILSGTDGLSDVDGSAATPAIRGTDANTGMFFPAADTIAFSEGGVESMRLDSSGNVGIGTSSPLGKLEVRGSGNTALYLHTGNNSGDNSLIYFGDTGSATVGLLAYDHGTNAMTFHTNSTERMRINNTGLVAIGTSTPAGRVTIAAPAATTNDLVLNGSTTSGVWTQYSNSSGSFYVGLDSSTGGGFGSAYSANLYHGGPYPMVFWTNAAERMRITSAGDLLVGTTAVAGTTSNSRSIVAGGFRSLNGELNSLVTGTAYTMFTAPADFCTWCVNVHGAVTDANYSETAIVQINNTSVRVDIISAGANVVISNSGLAIRVTQNAGLTMSTLYWSAFRIG